MPLHQTTRECLNAAGCTAPDGRPLYDYQFPDALLNGLIGDLTARLTNETPLDAAEAAAFCLALTKRGVPALNDSRLTWDALLTETLGEVPFPHRDQQYLREYTERGLSRFRRRLIQVAAGTRYLTTIWCEGGGPLALLEREHHAVGTFFREVLRVHTEYPARDLATIISEEEYRLPETLRNALVADLTREVVREARRVRRNLADHGVAIDHVAWLDQHDPDWRTRWPFAVTANTPHLLAFLAGLVTQRPQAAEIATFAIQTVLDQSGPETYSLRRYLPLPRSLESRHLASAAGMTDEEVGKLPPQQWWRLAAGTTEKDAAIVSHRGTGFTTTENSTQGLRGATATGQITLLSWRGTRKIFECPNLPGANALPESLWVFEDAIDNQPAVFVGGGSHSTRANSLLFAVPGNQPPEAEVDGSIARAGTIQDLVEPWSVFRLTGQAALWLSSDQGIIRLSTNVNNPRTRSFVLSGPRRSLGFTGTEVWCGVPTLTELDAYGHPTPVGREGLQWRAHGTHHWQSLADPCSCLGRVQLRYCENDEVLFRQTLDVLPMGFSCRSRGTNATHTGITQLAGLTPAPEISAAGHPDFTLDVQQAAGVAAIQVQWTGQGSPPLTYRLRLSWPNGRLAELTIASPIPDVSVVDAAGRRCDLPGPIPARLLSGLTLRATYPTECTPYLCDADGTKWASLFPDGPESVTYQLPLSTIADRVDSSLALSPAHGGFTRLSVRRNAHAIQGQSYLQVQRTAGQAHCDFDDVAGTCVLSIPPDRASQPWFQGALTLELCRLSNLNQPLSPDLSKQLDAHQWEINRRVLPPEGVMATLRGSNGACLSPRFVPPLAVPNEALPNADPDDALNEDGPLRLDDVVRMPNEATRFQAWKRLVKDMGRTPNHPDWQELNSLLKAATWLPENTFNAVEAIATQSAAPVACVVHNPALPALWPLFERLTFLWSLVPIDTWLQTIAQHHAHLATLGLDPDLVDTSLIGFSDGALRRLQPCMQPVVDSLAHVVPALADDDDLLKLDVDPLRLAQPLPPAMASHCAAQMASSLVEQAAGERWPDADVGLLTNDTVESLLDQFHLSADQLGPGLGYRRAVIFAPLFAASRVVDHVSVNDDIVRQIIPLRAFNRQWYDEMHSFSVYYLLCQRLCCDPDWLESKWRLGRHEQ